MEKEPWYKKYVVCLKLIGIFIVIYSGFLFVDLLTGFNIAVQFSALYGYLLFPACGVAYGIITYQKTKRVFIPSLIFFVVTMLFSVFLTYGFPLLSDSDILAGREYIGLRNSIRNSPIIGLATAISVIFATPISFVAALITKIYGQKQESS